MLMIVHFLISLAQASSCTDNWQETKYMLNDLLKHRACTIEEFTIQECKENIGLLGPAALSAKEALKTPKVQINTPKFCGAIPIKKASIEFSFFSKAFATSKGLPIIQTDYVKRGDQTAGCEAKISDIHEKFLTELEKEKQRLIKESNFEEAKVAAREHPELKALYEEKMKLRNTLFADKLSESDRINIRGRLNDINKKIGAWYEARPEAASKANYLRYMFWEIHDSDPVVQKNISESYGFKRNGDQIKFLEKQILDSKKIYVNGMELASQMEFASYAFGKEQMAKLVDLRVELAKREGYLSLDSTSKLAKSGFEKVRVSGLSTGYKVLLGTAAGTVMNVVMAAEPSELGCSDLYSKYETVLKVDGNCKTTVDLDGKLFLFLRASEEEQKKELQNSGFCSAIKELYNKHYPSTLVATCSADKNMVMIKDQISKNYYNAYFDASGDLEKFYSNHRDVTMDTFNVATYNTVFSKGVIKSIVVEKGKRKNEYEGGYLAAMFKNQNKIAETVKKDLTLYLPRMAELNQCCAAKLSASDKRCELLTRSEVPGTDGGKKTK